MSQPEGVAARGGDPLLGLPPGPAREAVIRALWWEAHAMRVAIHRQSSARRCDVVLALDALILGNGVVPVPPGSRRLFLGGECPCRDYLAHLVLGAHRFLVGHVIRPTNPPGAVRRHIRTRLAGDWIRERRTAVGAQARTDRIRGSHRARLLPDDFHRAVLEYVVDEAGSPAPLHDDEQFHRRLAERVADELGGPVESHLPAVRRALPAIEAVCRTGPTSDPGDGTQVTWWERYVERPLGRRPRRTDDVDALNGSTAAPLRLVGNHEVSDDLGALRVLLALPRDELETLLPRAIIGLADHGAIPRAVARSFLRDGLRVRHALDLLRSWPVGDQR